ncbi:MAG: hydroxymethylglutaryl-CoA reductase, degradative [Gammaproteobacteria bacterium]|nr:hydroxymethylglutaryl-CoA reductase, degradative [Gammaproteobacteria bacterium]
MDKSRIPRFYKMSVDERVEAVRTRGIVNADDHRALASGEHTLNVEGADKMIENVIGVMGMPVGLGLNFVVNGKDYVVPLVVEEPSIVAALSSAAKTARESGGFETSSTDPILIGQVQVVGVSHIQNARAKLLQNKEEIINLANSMHPNMVARGGGAIDIEVFTHPTGNDIGDMLVMHLLVNTCDAMGANLVNTMCEGVASLVEKITGGEVFLRILSNLTDRAMVTARTTIAVDSLNGRGFSGEQVRDGIIIASEFARIDPYRAATHNKGIMNGVDALVLATGNDWRAVEAGVHAYAARGHQYTSLSSWSKNHNGDLVGTLTMPIKVGIVGGPLQSNPTVAMNIRMTGVKHATELAELMGAVGLAQNFAALRALVTDGIQKGHMTLHARSVVMAAGAGADIFDKVVDRLLESQQIKIWKARELITELQNESASQETSGQAMEIAPAAAAGHGKIILLGEHSVVYNRHAIAIPAPVAIRARVAPSDHGVRLSIPNWGVDHYLERDPIKRTSFENPAATILDKLGLADQNMTLEVFPAVPRAMGLGGSAAIAVAIIRALSAHYQLNLTDQQVNELALESEKIAHGNPSGVDNTVATFGQPMLYQRGSPPTIRTLDIPSPVAVVVGMTGVESLTASMVSRVNASWQKNPKRYERMFDEMDALALEGANALEQGDWKTLGELMNVGQGFLNALQVSCWELEELIQIARDNGAAGAKLTGGGGGGAMVALCPDNPQRVIKAMNNAGYRALEFLIGPRETEHSADIVAQPATGANTDRERGEHH